MTLEILLAALLLYLAVRALVVLIVADSPTQRAILIVLLIVAIVWLIVYGNIPPLQLAAG